MNENKFFMIKLNETRLTIYLRSFHTEWPTIKHANVNGSTEAKCVHREFGVDLSHTFNNKINSILLLSMRVSLQRHQSGTYKYTTHSFSVGVY